MSLKYTISDDDATGSPKEGSIVSLAETPLSETAFLQKFKNLSLSYLNKNMDPMKSYLYHRMRNPSAKKAARTTVEQTFPYLLQPRRTKRLTGFNKIFSTIACLVFTPKNLAE